MGTQKTRLPDPTRPMSGEETPQPFNDKNPAYHKPADLGIPTDGGPIAEDPTGYVAKGDPQELHGRRVRPVTDEDLREAHRLYAGDNTPMLGETSLSGPDGNMDQAPRQAASPAPEDPSIRQDAARLTPGFLRQQQQSQQPQYQRPNMPPPPDTTPRPEQEQTGPPGLQFQQVAATIEKLLEEEEAARDRGDYEGAKSARDMVERLSEGYHIRRTPRTAGRHPVMRKLLANLGLEKIQRTSIEWGGSKWTFSPTNARLDSWMSENVRDDASNFAALMISSAIVAIDGVPVFEALGLPLSIEYVVEQEGSIRKFSTPAYHKYCNCGFEVPVDATECKNCGAGHDPLDMPMELRIKCAEDFNRMLEEEFGAYEELAFLLDQKSKVMKDRRLDKEDLYPLAKPSPEQQKMLTSRPGDE